MDLAKRFGVEDPKELRRVVRVLRATFPERKCLYLVRRQRARKPCGKCPVCYADRLEAES